MNPTATLLPPTPTQFVTTTSTPHPLNEPGLIDTLGTPVPGPWYPARVVFSPDGKVIASVGTSITLWDVSSYKLIRQLSNPYARGWWLFRRHGQV